jgi:uncharacterized membrane protein YfcA
LRIGDVLLGNEILVFLIAFLVGIFGSMLGIGGGVLLIPILSTFFSMPIKIAIGASSVSVIATSSAASMVYVSHGFTHTRLAMVLEIATTAGALAGGITAALINPRFLTGFLGLVLLYVAYQMSSRRSEKTSHYKTGLMDTEFIDPITQSKIEYGVRKLPYGLGLSFIAGNISGLLGIGGGVIKVPVMNLVLGLPLRAAIATSNFMIGITAATSAIIYYQHDIIKINVAVPTALGVLFGAQIGARIGTHIKKTYLNFIFQVVLVIFAVIMFYKVFQL